MPIRGMPRAGIGRGGPDRIDRSGEASGLCPADRDVLTLTAEEARDTKVLWTVVGGKTVYGAPALVRVSRWFAQANQGQNFRGSCDLISFLRSFEDGVWPLKLDQFFSDRRHLAWSQTRIPIALISSGPAGNGGSCNTPVKFFVTA